MTIQKSKWVIDLWVVRKKPERVCQGETRRQASRCRWRILSRRAGGTRAFCCCGTKWCKPWLGVWTWSEGETERNWGLEKKSKEERCEGDWHEALLLLNFVCICSFVECVRFNYGDQIDSELHIFFYLFLRQLFYLMFF